MLRVGVKNYIRDKKLSLLKTSIVDSILQDL